ncbi:cytochrome P450, partial [Chaetomidium leptoderma]
GHDSTANTLCWFVRYMEAHPSIQTELRAALKTAFFASEDPSVVLPSAAQILQADMPYLDGACEEGVRLAGTAKANLRQALVDTHILGCPVPKGAEIFMNYHINRSLPPATAVPVVDEAKRSKTSRAAGEKRGDALSRGVAGRDLGSFQPRRWIVVDEMAGKESFNAYSLPSLAFGGGYRGCFGRKLAMMEFKIVVVLLMLSFEFLSLPEEFKSMAATEKIFREPDFPYVKLRGL